MSNALKSAAESTVHTLSDFVEGARDRLEDVIENVENVIGNVKDELPPLKRAKHERHTGRWVVIAMVAVLFVVGMMRRRRSTDDVAEKASKDSGASRVSERSRAVS